jgi:hypothetical protein
MLLLLLLLLPVLTVAACSAVLLLKSAHSSLYSTTAATVLCSVFQEHTAHLLRLLAFCMYTALGWRNVSVRSAVHANRLMQVKTQ